MKTSYFCGLNTAHFISTILKGHPRNTCQMCRAGQIKFAVFRLQNIFSSFSVVIWHPSDTAAIALKSTVLEYFSNELSVSTTVADTVSCHIYTVAAALRLHPPLRWNDKIATECNGKARNGLSIWSCNQGLSFVDYLWIKVPALLLKP